MIWNNQKEEIKTICRRPLVIRLSDADVERLAEKAAWGGLTVAELLQNFIGDLVDGTYSNGSDERMYAQEWYERCWFGSPYADEGSLLQYLARNDNLYRFFELRESLDWAENDLQDDDLTLEEKEEIRQNIKDWQEELAQICGKYTDPDEIKKVLAWHEETKEMEFPSKEIYFAMHAVHFAAGQEFDVNSPSELARVLFEDLGLPPVKKTENGYSTDDEVLEQLRSYHPVIEAVITYRAKVAEFG